MLPDDSDSLLSDQTAASTAASAASSTAPSPSSSASASPIPPLPLMERSGSSLGLKRLSVSQAQLKKAWEVSQRSTGDDWVEWFRVLSIELLKESPSPPLRACSILAQKHHCWRGSCSPPPSRRAGRS